jgi:hypothetical protein
MNIVHKYELYLMTKIIFIHSSSSCSINNKYGMDAAAAAAGII